MRDSEPRPLGLGAGIWLGMCWPPGSSSSAVRVPRLNVRLGSETRSPTLDHRVERDLRSRRVGDESTPQSAHPVDRLVARLGLLAVSFVPILRPVAPAVAVCALAPPRPEGVSKSGRTDDLAQHRVLRGQALGSGRDAASSNPPACPV